MNRIYKHIARTTALALLVALGASCGKDSPIAPDPDNGQGTPVDIGRLLIADTPDAANTRLSNDGAWQDGDAIVVTATDATDATQQAIYTYNGSTWTIKNGKALYVEHISPTGISIETWGGYTDDGLTANASLYTDQSDPDPIPADYETGDRYRHNDYLLSTNATLSGRTLNGTLAHLRVDFVVNIKDGDNFNELPSDAVLTLNTDGNDTSSTDASNTDANSTPAQKQTKIIAYRLAKTSEGITTFRAHIDLADVPGISLTNGSNATGNVPSGSLLGTLTYTIPASGTAGSTPIQKTLKMRYSITSTTDADGSSTSGSNIPILAGKRITVSTTFADLSYLNATATLQPWKDIDGGDAGTLDIGMRENGTGSNGEPMYEIYAAQGMKEFADLVNGMGIYAGKGNRAANAILTADVDLRSLCGPNGESWTPIGIDKSRSYTGCFNGNGKTVSRLYISYRSDVFTGLFGYISKERNDRVGTIENLHVNAEKVRSINFYTGILAGYNDGGIITNCDATGDVSGSDNTGGLVGRNENGGTITDCNAKANVKGVFHNTGGLVGYNNKAIITGCHAESNVEGTHNSNGGLVGFNDVDATITNCYATGKVSGRRHTGGLVGYNMKGTIENSNATGSVSGTEYTGGLVGYNDNKASITGCHADGQVSGKSHNTGGLVGINNLNATITNCYATGITSGEGNNNGGLVGYNNKATITNCYAEGNVEGALNSNGGLVGCNNKATITKCHATGNVTGKGQYTGGLVGYNNQNATITDECYATGTVKGVKYNTGGLVGYNNQSATITNGCYATGEVEGADVNTGGLVGCNDSCAIVTNCHANGKVIGKSHITGGLVGYNNHSSKIEKCYATGEVQGEQHNVGGLVGYNENSAIITGCHATNNVNGKQNSNGGLVGRSSKSGIITHCYATGNVTGQGQYNGGLVGYNDQSATITHCHAESKVSGGNHNAGGLVGINESNAIITCCYATGSVEGNQNSAGGLVGCNSTSTIIGCYATGHVTGKTFYIGGLAGCNIYSATITGCYATGNVEGPNTIGGLVGENYGSTIIACYATGSASGTTTPSGLVGNNTNTGSLLYCATTQSNITSENSGSYEGSQDNVSSFTDIRSIVTSNNAQSKWGRSIDADGHVQEDTSGRVLNGLWSNPSGDANDPGNATAIWKSAVEPIISDSSIGSLQLWWQP